MRKKKPVDSSTGLFYFTNLSMRLSDVVAVCLYQILVLT